MVFWSFLCKNKLLYYIAFEFCLVFKKHEFYFWSREPQFGTSGVIFNFYLIEATFKYLKSFIKDWKKMFSHNSRFYLKNHVILRDKYSHFLIFFQNRNWNRQKKMTCLEVKSILHFKVRVQKAEERQLLFIT